ncbi:MAG: hypothetical protein KatS3mg108_0665 [Isosphaeraceae bacterium]|jgi:hypothetical protein|nr:MAG: hypothetical protein KatS3mg108_0665 [Isosphaeraceae bacterium]
MHRRAAAAVVGRLGELAALLFVGPRVMLRLPGHVAGFVAAAEPRRMRHGREQHGKGDEGAHGEFFHVQYNITLNYNINLILVTAHLGEVVPNMDRHGVLQSAAASAGPLREPYAVR